MPDSIADQAFYGTVFGRVFEVWVHLHPPTHHNSSPVGLKSDLPLNIIIYMFLSPPYWNQIAFIWKSCACLCLSPSPASSHWIYCIFYLCVKYFLQHAETWTSLTHGGHILKLDLFTKILLYLKQPFQTEFQTIRAIRSHHILSQHTDCLLCRDGANDGGFSLSGLVIYELNRYTSAALFLASAVEALHVVFFFCFVSSRLTALCTP